MSHAYTILLHSVVLDNQLIIGRYSTIIVDTLQRLQNLKIDVAISAIVKNIPDYDRLDLVDNILSLCHLAKDDGTSIDFDSYTRDAIERFSFNEQLCILAHTDLLSIDKPIEDVESLLSKHFYQAIHNNLVQGSLVRGTSVQGASKLKRYTDDQSLN